MRFRTMVALNSMVLLLLAQAAWSRPLPNSIASLVAGKPESHSISGKIASVGETQLTLDILKDQKSGIVAFVIDQETSLEGKLTVGAPAAVDYRVEGEKMIATRVVITKACGVAAR